MARCAKSFAQEKQGVRNAFLEFARCRGAQITGIERERDQLQCRLDGGDAVVTFQFVDRDLGQGGESEAAFHQFHQGRDGGHRMHPLSSDSGVSETFQKCQVRLRVALEREQLPVQQFVDTQIVVSAHRSVSDEHHFQWKKSLAGNSLADNRCRGKDQVETAAADLLVKNGSCFDVEFELDVRLIVPDPFHGRNQAGVEDRFD